MLQDSCWDTVTGCTRRSAQPQGIEWFQDSDEKKQSDELCVARRFSGSIDGCGPVQLSLSHFFILFSVPVVFLILGMQCLDMPCQVLHVGAVQQ